MKWVTGAAMLAFLLGPLVGLEAQGEYRNLSSVLDGSGTMSTNTVTLPDGKAYTNISAAGQPGGIFISSGGGMTNYAGFLQAVDIKRPDLRDPYGNPYELTTDNDADNLSDLAEILGTNFDPVTATEVNNADTDGDGQPDGAESVAGTDPTNRDLFLQITEIMKGAGNEKVVEWVARDNKRYRSLTVESPNFTCPGNNVVGTVDVHDVSAPAPWYQTTGTFTNTSALNNRYYIIQVQSGPAP